jgi:hypothetical protein
MVEHEVRRGNATRAATETIEIIFIKSPCSQRVDQSKPVRGEHIAIICRDHKYFL